MFAVLSSTARGFPSGDRSEIAMFFLFHHVFPMIMVPVLLVFRRFGPFWRPCVSFVEISHPRPTVLLARQTTRSMSSA